MSWKSFDGIVNLLEEMEDPRPLSSLGELLRDLRKARGLDSDEDAARLVGISYRQYQRWLSGESEPRGHSLKLISDAFDVPIRMLVGVSEELVPDETQLDRIEDLLNRLAAALLEEAVSDAEEAAPPAEASTPKRAPRRQRPR